MEVIAFNKDGSINTEDPFKELEAWFDEKCPIIKGKKQYSCGNLQELINFVYYQSEGRLGFETIGETDITLARAKAFENDYTKLPICEVGSGMFQFAKNILKNMTSPVQYTCYDFTDSFVSFAPKEVSFVKGSIDDAVNNITQPTNVLMVELFDDAYTDFYSLRDGKIKKAYASFNARENQEAIFRDGSKVPSKEVLESLEQGDTESFRNLSRKSLTNFEISDKCTFSDVPFELFKEDTLETRNLTSAIKDLLYEQCKETNDFVTVPVAGIQTLWDLKNKDARIDVFDYGYTSPTECKKINYFDSQVTTPVNFTLLHEAANLMGYKSILETDDKYIQRQLGIDTINLVYLHRIIESFPEVKHPLMVPDILIGAFSDDIKKIEPDVEVNIHNIKGHRIKRENMNGFIGAYEEVRGNLVTQKYKTGRYHLGLQ